ncbi:MAG: hypothetical protein OXE99_02735, partial [Cellvibrionales bacterium]|nr:hypothetical protein [Cellvibrionales bacterium]
MKRNNVFTAIFALTSLLNFADTQNSYQGSQAYNANYKGNLSVNQATGTLYFSYPLIQAPGVYQAFHFNIEYRRNQKALFGLPKSWRFSLDYIDGKTANINNQQWLTDPLWHDEQGFGSGLRYFNLHSTKFFDAGFVLPVPNRPDLRYRYRLTLKDGTKKYFSHEGWLIYINDRFGNTIEFHYSPIAEDLKSSRLDWIKDEYGNKYVFRYAPQSLTIISPDKRETTLYFNEHGVTQIINPIQQSIDIHYIEQYGQSLIQSIETAEGLITELHFSTIDIKQHGKIVKLPVIDAVNKTDKKGTQLLEQTFYSHALDNNFTGFPKYSLSDTTDNLIDSNDQSFRYSVTVKRNQLRTDKAAFHQQTFYYNYLHLPVDIITTLDNQPLTKTCFEYDISPFRYSRLTNYDKPITTTNYIWIKDTASWLASDRKTATYDWFGNQTEEKHEVYNRTTQSWVAIYGSGATFDNDYYGLPKEKRITDYIQSQHIQTRYTFTDDHKAHKSKTVTFKKDKDTDWQLWKTYQLTYDAKGRKVYEKMAWAENTAIQPNSTCIHTQYEQDDEKHQLTRTETSALGNKKQFIFDTQSGFLIQSITPKGDNTNYQYDAIGRLIKVSDSLGIRQITQYKDFQTDNLNATTVTSPLGCQKRTRYDALKRPLENQDFYGKSWRQLEAFKYDGLGNKIQETNRLGLSTKRQFDTQNRLIEETDPWGNHKTLTYKDNQLTTDIHLNHNKLMTILSVPWENTLIQRMYPLASKEEPLLTPIENTQKKNGFGQVYLTKLANTKDTLTTTLCSYDPEHNPSVCEYKTKEALTLNEYHEYDLFNNRIHTVKIQQENGQTYKISTIRQLFSRDNNLISLT